jgi:putative hemolysin
MSPGVLVFLATVLLLLIASSALFSAIETALFSLQRFQIERLKNRKAAVATTMARLMENPRRVLSVILLLDALANLPLSLLCLFLLRNGVSSRVPFWASALLIFALVVFVCDLVPKLLALAETERIATVGVRVLNWLMPVLEPLARVLQRFSERIADLMTPSQMQPHAHLSDEELETLVEISAEAGALHETESEMIQEIIKLGDKTAKDCMTPRVDMFAVPDDLTDDELLPMLREKRYRRIPVYGETPDDIVGVLEVNEFLLEPGVSYVERLIPPSFVSETMKAIDLLRSFLQHPQGLAIVVDEHGGTEGMVTLSDLVEEIISDAVPKTDEALYIEPVGGDQFLVSGNARLDDLNELLTVKLEAEGLDTIGGFIFNRLGTLPRPGTQLEVDGLSMTVRRTSRKRIEEVLIRQRGGGVWAEGEGEGI